LDPGDFASRVSRDLELGTSHLERREMFDSLGKLLIVFGVVLALVGGLLMLAGKVSFLGRLPGDIVVRRENWSFYFPVTTCIVISVLLTLLVRFFGRR
jgi:hypothetical protein